MTRLRGVIFDLDGVLVHTDRYHYLAWKSVAEELGVPFDERKNDRLRGVSRLESLKIVLEDYPARLTEAEKRALAEEKNRRYRALLSALTPDDVAEETRETLTALREAGLRLAVGSSSRNAKYILERAALAPYFDAVADGGEIVRSKPDPEVFLLAARKLGLAPSDCAVVEDAASGIEAARAGGFLPVAMGNAPELSAAKCRIVSLAELVPLCKIG